MILSKFEVGGGAFFMERLGGGVGSFLIGLCGGGQGFLNSIKSQHYTIFNTFKLKISAMIQKSHCSGPFPRKNDKS